MACKRTTKEYLADEPKIACERCSTINVSSRAGVRPSTRWHVSGLSGHGHKIAEINDHVQFVLMHYRRLKDNSIVSCARKVDLVGADPKQWTVRETHICPEQQERGMKDAIAHHAPQRSLTPRASAKAITITTTYRLGSSQANHQPPSPPPDLASLMAVL